MKGMGEGAMGITGGGLGFYTLLAGFGFGFGLLTFFYFSSSCLTAFTISAIRDF
jgi:hypothetical protein